MAHLVRQTVSTANLQAVPTEVNTSQRPLLATAAIIKNRIRAEDGREASSGGGHGAERQSVNPDDERDTMLEQITICEASRGRSSLSRRALDQLTPIRRSFRRLENARLIVV